MRRTLALALLLTCSVAACTSYSEETWIEPSIGRLPDAAPHPADDGRVDGD